MKRKLKRPETAYDNITIQFVATVQLNKFNAPANFYNSF